MKLKIISVLLFIILLFGCSTPGPEKTPAQDLGLIKQRVFDLYTGKGVPSPTPGPYLRASRLALAEKAEPPVNGKEWGTWPDSDKDKKYEDKVARLYRTMLILAQAYQVPGQPHFRSPGVKKILKEKMTAALEVTRRGSKRPGNWYPWFIGIPRSFCPLLVLTEKMYTPEFHQEQLAALHSLIDNGPHLSGQNGIWEGNNALIEAALLSDNDRAREAMRFISRESGLSLHSGGVLEDYSYQFHDRTLYTGGYGAGYIFRMALTLYLTRGTGYELPKEKQELFARFMTGHGFWPLIRGCFDLSVLGRSTNYGGHPQSGYLNGAMILSGLENGAGFFLTRPWLWSISRVQL